MTLHTLPSVAVPLLRMLHDLVTIFLLFAWLPSVVAIGLSIPPVLTGDKKRYSTPHNLANCISYLTSKDDIITVKIKAGEKQTSQVLNLNVFDSQKNVLRTLEDLEQDQVVMFTNLDYQATPEEKKRKRFLEVQDKTEQDDIDLLPLVPEKTYVHICFDNIYSDRSWSFQKQPRDLSLTVDIRSLASLKKTNYKIYAKYFTQNSESAKMRDDLDFEFDFTQESFESAVKKLQVELNEVSEELKQSLEVVQNLKFHERRLRDMNEEIFENYMRTSVLLLCTIAGLGMIQLFYYKFYFKRRKLI